jgi:septal ring factor EnvC (AmiA/AmiB activator)
MMALRTKLYFVASLPAALSMATFYLSATVDGGDAAFLYRLGLTFAIAGFLFCLVTWDIHRVTELREELAFTNARLAAAEKRADDADERAAAAEERMAKLEARLSKIEEDLECRRLAKRLWTGADDDQLRNLLQPEDN